MMYHNKKRLEKVEKMLQTGKQYKTVVIIEKADGTREIEIDGIRKEMSNEELEKEIVQLEQKYKIILLTIGELTEYSREG